MKKIFTLLVALFLMTNFISARDIYVATTGNDNNQGTEASPYANIQKAIDEASSGDIIYVRGGTYMLTKRIKIEKAGTENAHISLFGYPGERVILDGSTIVTNNVNEFKQARCIYVNHFGDYWHLKNLEFCNAKDNGMKMEGSYNIIENGKFYDNNDNCMSFDNLHKGFDQNNAYEAMYLFNNVAWGNEYNYRFPTVFEYGTMYMRNNIGFKSTMLKMSQVADISSLSAGVYAVQIKAKDGYVITKKFLKQ